MSVNLIAAIEGTDRIVRPMILTRFSAGITSRACVSRGDVITFPSGIELKVDKVIHRYQSPGADIAPNTDVYAFPDRPMYPEEIEALKNDGFQDMGA